MFILPLFVVAFDSACRVGLLNRNTGVVAMIRTHTHAGVARQTQLGHHLRFVHSSYSVLAIVVGGNCSQSNMFVLSWQPPRPSRGVFFHEPARPRADCAWLEEVKVFFRN